MKYLILAILFLAMPVRAVFLEPKPGIFPLEFELILKFAQKNANENELKNISSIIRIIDTEGQKLTQEELMFVTKTEVYKSLLKPENNDPITMNFNYTALANELRNTRGKYKKDPLFLWLINSLSEDLSSIIESTIFKDLMLIKKSDRGLTSDLQKIDRKLFLITKLALEVTTAADSATPVSLIKKSLRTLENVQIAFQILAKYGRPAPISTEPLAPGAFRFFIENGELEKNDNNAQPDLRSAPKPTRNDKSIDQILAPVIEGKAQDLPKPVNEKDWAPSGSNKKDLPKPVNETEWLPDN